MTQRVWSEAANRWYTTLDWAEKLWPKVDRSGGPDACWPFTGARNRGYGTLKRGPVNRVAHRVAYEDVIGPVPDGMQLDHLCRNRACVNPAHLEPVTCRENLLRGETLNAVNTAKAVCLRGHPLAGENLYIARGRRHCRACRREASRRSRRAAA